MTPPVGLLAEIDLARYCHSAATMGGWHLEYYTRRSDMSPAGFPDRIWIHAAAGLIVAAELKGYDARGRLGQPSEDQIEWLAGLRAAGVPAFLWAPEDRPEIDEVLARRRVPPVDQLPELPDGVPRPRGGRR